MSRSNPHEHGAPNPATRYYEWHGAQGCLRYYDKDAKKNIDVPLTFRFMLLDQLGSVRGFHEATKSGIYSNEIRDTRQDVLVVKASKGSVTLAEGVYKDIKDRVTSKAVGGQFVANCYIAVKTNGTGELKIASLRLKGAALGAWMEFCKANRAALFKKAIAITGSADGQKGSVRFKTPLFKTVEISSDSDAKALELDKELQDYLTGYLKRTKRDQAEAAAAGGPQDEPGYDASNGQITGDAGAFDGPVDDDIPF
jgi:hypothetical protein